MNLNFKKNRVLLLEDEPSIADAVEFVLQQEGFEILRAGLIAEAREVLMREPLDFVVLDIGLPDGSGLEFCKEIRTHSSVPLLFLTARHEEIDRILGLEIGADDYVTKPFSPRELAARVKAILKRSAREGVEKHPEEKTQVQAYGPYQVDVLQRSISMTGRVLDLSKNEYSLLHFLLENQKRVFSRWQLMEAVWEEPGSAAERTVDAHIKSLRKKIGEKSGIQTHRGFGYSMNTQSSAEFE